MHSGGALSAGHHCHQQFSGKFSAGPLDRRVAIPSTLILLADVTSEISRESEYGGTEKDFGRGGSMHFLVSSVRAAAKNSRE